ncbi:hypothetical protein BUALT_Bualt03G0090500 [Buddleja alternifolia]|uniref:Uncharacterized protein n=1 Tax=Buddleja alternifolia TaxID=168488 RepID=A0AAV6XSB6_9LAMI|nr:hypothetical protein BUALT_Bualt03G0090500 [Buddleja alternifolia]
MGNCIGTVFALSHNHEKVPPNDNEADMKASAELCEAPLSLAAILRSGDVYRLMPRMIQQSSLQSTPENCNGQRIKIVVTKKQLQLITRHRVELIRMRHIAVQPLVRRGKKWRPPLSTIPEL